jgi:hypothetical protein
MTQKLVFLGASPINRCQKGFILLPTIMIIGIVGLLVLSHTASIFLYYKAENHLQARHHTLQQLEAAAMQVLTSIYPSHCILANQDANNSILRLKKQQGCSVIINKQHYMFVIEELGVFPCLKVQNINNNYSTKHVRVTLLSTTNKPMILQLRIAHIIPVLTCRGHRPIFIKPGIISWRYV